MPVNVMRTFGSFPAWDYGNGPVFLQAVYKADSGISLIRDSAIL